MIRRILCRHIAFCVEGDELRSSRTLIREQGLEPVEVLFVGGFANGAQSRSDLGALKLLDPGHVSFVATSGQDYSQRKSWL